MNISIQISENEHFELLYTSTDNNRLIFPFNIKYYVHEPLSMVSLGIADKHEDILNLFGDEIDNVRKAVEAYSDASLEWRPVPSKGFLQPAIVSSNDEQVTDFGNISLNFSQLEH